MSSENEIKLEELNVAELAEKIKQRAQEASNEEELRIGFAIVLDPILRSWNIKPAYERHATGVRCVVSGVRKDALYGTVILEFKSPGKLKNKKEFEKAKEQVKEYIKSEAVTSEYYGRYFGVLIDGYQIAFIRFRKGLWEEPLEPLEINAQTILRLLEAIRGLRRKPIDAQLLLEDFGPKSEISKKAVLILYKTLINPKSSRSEVLFKDWKRVFSQVCAYSKEKLEGLITYYELKGHKIIDVEKLMFTIHTYYTLLMKLLTSEIVTLFADSLIGSYLKKLEEAYLRDKESMLNELRELEEGGIFAELGIKNFLEADYFGWYLDEWNEEIATLIYEITEKLLDYEPATVELTPERIKDLFKKLYQNLVPRDIRHKLGEYFTPDWLTELLLDEIGYDGNPEKRVLDPACGSGTFLVLVIKRIQEYAKENFIDERTLLTKIIKNVQGIDLNPLAVLASKANYIITLANLLRYRPKEGIEIPIYLADSILTSRKVKPTGELEVYLKTIVGEFKIPGEVIDKGFLSRVLNDINFCLKNKYSIRDFKEFIEKRYELNEYSIQLIVKLYEKLESLDKDGKNKIWTRILKNSFAPLLIGEFDYVIGNPPWINWENLPEFYRNETKDLWDWYTLLKKTKGMGLGKVKRDMAMLFVTKCLDRFTKNGGKLAFLTPFTVYKTQAGAGFREFLAKGRVEHPIIPCKVLKVHDLVTLYPFEGAVNRTSLIIIEKNGETEFPIPCIMWYNPRVKGVAQEAELEEVKKTTKRFELILIPIEKSKSESPWMEITEKAYEGIKKVIGESPWYKAYEGVNTALNQVYWIDILSETQDGLLVTNPPISGQKKQVKQVRQIIERNLVYPLVRGRDVKKWYYSGELGSILLPVSSNGDILSHSELKTKYHKTWEYFNNFIEILVNRGGEPYKSKLEPYRIKKFEIAEKIAPPFYWLFNVKPSLTLYKVVWKRIAGAITGKAISFASTVLEPYKGRPIILNDSLILIPFEKPEEAYYVSGVLNSSIALLAIASYTYELRQETHITQYIRIPKFDQSNPFHQKLSQLSQKAHELAKKYYEQNDLVAQDGLRKVEEEIDKTVAQLYGIDDEELNEIKKCLMILKEGEISEEEESNEEELPIDLYKKNIEIKIEPLLIEENTEKELTISIQNNTSQSIKNGSLKVNLKLENLLIKKVKELKPNDKTFFKFKIPKLKCGEHELKIEFSFNNEKIEEVRKLFIKSKKISKKETKSFLDEELEELLK
jgi:methylase of polypeptide subunit release factors